MAAPLIAWAAVAPDGTIDERTVCKLASATKFCVGRQFNSQDGIAGWEQAERAGWRVVQVEIRVKEEQDG